MCYKKIKIAPLRNLCYRLYCIMHKSSTCSCGQEASERLEQIAQLASENQEVEVRKEKFKNGELPF